MAPNESGHWLLLEAGRRGLSQTLVSARLSSQVRVILHEFEQGLTSRECPILAGVGPRLGDLVEAPEAGTSRPASGSRSTERAVLEAHASTQNPGSLADAPCRTPLRGRPPAPRSVDRLRLADP